MKQEWVWMVIAFLIGWSLNSRVVEGLCFFGFESDCFSPCASIFNKDCKSDDDCVSDKCNTFTCNRDRTYNGFGKCE